MDRETKQTVVDGLNEDFQKIDALFAFDYRGLKVEEATDLRRKVRESGASYRVVKNTLMRRAVSGTGIESLVEHFNGMTGVAYTTEDPVALAKVLSDFAKDVPALSFKCGLISDQAVDESQFKHLASLPSKDELYSKLLSVFQAPMRNLLGVMQAPARDFILLLKAAGEKK